MKNKFTFFYKRFIPFILLVCMLTAFSKTYGQEQSKDSTVIEDYEEGTDTLTNINENDSTFTREKLTPGDSIAGWRNNKGFAYIHYLDSLLRHEKDLKNDTVSIDNKTGRIKRGSRSLLPKNVSGLNNILNSLPLQILFWAMAVFFIAFIVYKVFFKGGLFSGSKGEVMAENNEEPELELSDTSKYDSLIAEAENKNNFNLAVRYLYLKTLKVLSEKELIHFTPDKTNKEYLMEMSPNNYFEEFRLLTRNYEYAWYGKFSVNETVYQKLKQEFNLFNNKA